MPTGGNGRPLRVAHLIQTLCVGGIERMVLELATAIAPLGVHCEGIAYVRDGALREAFDAAGVRTTFLATSPGLQPRLGLRVARVLRDHQIDILHSHHLGPFLYGAVAAAAARVPHVHTEHSVELYDEPRRRALARLMPRLCRLVHVAPEIARWRQDHLGRAGEVVPNGVFVPPAPTAAGRRAAREALDLPAGTFVVGCVARLDPEKDHLTLLEGFGQLQARLPDSHLVLAGAGTLRGALEARADVLGLGDRVRFLGSVLDVQAVLPAFDVKALTSTREGLPLALLEAMAHGMPAVATAVGGLPGLLASGGGLLVAPGSPSAVADALYAYASDPAARAEAGALARQRVSEGYSLGAMAGRYADIYRQVAR